MEGGRESEGDHEVELQRYDAASRASSTRRAAATSRWLISARGANPNPPMNLGKPLESSGEPTGGAVKKRSLSFMRRKKAAEAAGETAVV